MPAENTIKYKVIKEEIKESIRKGELRTHDKLPSEYDLCQKYQVSRITVTRAINDLVTEGFLIREQGKGTYVKREIIKEGVLKLTGFYERMAQKGYELQTRVIERKIVDAPQAMIEAFMLKEDEKVIVLKRLRIVNGEPLCLSISYLMPEVFYWVLFEDMEANSLFALLEDKYHYILGEASELIKIEYLPEEDARLLHIKKTDPCLGFILTCALDSGVKVQYEETFYIGDKYVYQTKMSRHV